MAVLFSIVPDCLKKNFNTAIINIFKDLKKNIMRRETKIGIEILEEKKMQYPNWKFIKWAFFPSRLNMAEKSELQDKQ